MLMYPSAYVCRFEFMKTDARPSQQSELWAGTGIDLPRKDLGSVVPEELKET